MQQRLRNKLFEQKRCPYYLTLFSRTVGFMPHALLALRVTKKNLDLSFTVQAFINRLVSERSSQRPELSNSASKLEILFWNVDIVLKSNTMTRLNVTYVDTIHSSHSESCDSWQFIPFREPITIIVLKECHIKPHAFPPFTLSCFSIPAITSVRRDFCQASARSSYLLYHPL